MLCLYLITRPGDTTLVVCSQPEALAKILGDNEGWAAYHLGRADQGIPPGMVAVVSELDRLIMQNARNVATGERDR